ncbi:IAA-amido synthase, partial [Tanacetum coccineum]
AASTVTWVHLTPMVKPSEVSYTILPNMTYFEFKPQEDSGNSEPIDITDVELGKEYEVISTYSDETELQNAIKKAPGILEDNNTVLMDYGVHKLCRHKNNTRAL